MARVVVPGLIRSVGMTRRVWDRDRSNGPRTDVGTFELEAFTWSAPDELQLAGRFVGFEPATQDVPQLVVHGSGETHRLAPLPGGEQWPPGDDEPWRATFGWDEPPTPIDSAELLIGERVLPLPEPGSGTAAAAATPAPSAPADRLRDQADLVLAREELSRARSAHDAAHDELTRVKEQLEDERRARAADSERFREDIDALRAMAEETITAEREAAESLGGELAAVREDAERAVAKAAILADERDAALARVEFLEAAATELEDLRERAAAMAEREAHLEAELGETEAELENLRAVTERVSERLQGIRSIGEGG